MYEIKAMSPEPVMPKRPRPMAKKIPLPTRPYFNEPMSASDYIYQQTLKPKQKPPTWRLIPADGIPTRNLSEDLKIFHPSHVTQDWTYKPSKIYKR